MGKEGAATVFISYARADADAVKEIHGNLQDQEHNAFFDREIRGGQDWWDAILEQIRSCPIFLFAVSPDSLGSRACRVELAYAHALRRAIVPIAVRGYRIEDAPDVLQTVNIFDFVNPDVGTYGKLDSILDGIEEDPPGLPDPLPDHPRVPIADLSTERQLVERETLDAGHQLELIASLAGKVRNADDRLAVVALLTKLKGRGDVTAAAAKEAAVLIARNRPPPRDPQATKLLKSVVRALEKETCVPILGSGMIDWLVGSRKLLAQEWAKEYGYPLRLGGRDDLPQIAQYISVTETDEIMREGLGDFYSNQLKKTFPDVRPDGDRLNDLIVGVWKAEALNMVAEPHDVLARLPCKMYISTEPTGLLREALQALGKEPREDFCRWNDELRDAYPASGMRTPTIDEPLVYHVFGTLEHPESIVITEDDYFDFLGAVAQDPGLIPTEIRETIAESSLLLLGFGLQDWDVRVVLRALVNREIADHLDSKKHVAAEIDPIDDTELLDGAREYLRDYFGRNSPRIDIFWSSVEAFCEGLESVRAEKVGTGV